MVCVHLASGFGYNIIDGGYEIWAEHREALARRYVSRLRAFGFSGDTEAFGTPCNVAGAATKSAVIPCTAQKGRVALALRAQTQEARYRLRRSKNEASGSPDHNSLTLAAVSITHWPLPAGRSAQRNDS